MTTVVDPTGIFEASPRRAAYIVACDQLDRLADLLETQEVLTGYMQNKNFLKALHPKLTDDPIQLASMISSFSGLRDLIKQMQLALLAFGLITTTNEREMDVLSSKLER
jgi:hypothetical protein